MPKPNQPMLKLMFFAKIADDLATRSTTIELGELKTVSDVIAFLASVHGPRWAEVLTQANVIYAVNQHKVAINQTISAGDEIAFMPPMTGG